MTVQEARDKKVCRVCEQLIENVAGPNGWQTEFGCRTFPKPSITLNYGDEFAHTDCLHKEKEINNVKS